jgi:Transposase DDE domain
MVREQRVCLRRLSGGLRCEEVRFGRFLGHGAVTLPRIIASWSEGLAAAVEGRHVLALQDTSEVKFVTNEDHRRGLGKVKKGNTHGVLLHPMLALDADSGVVLGLTGGQIWTRGPEELIPHAKRFLSEKESRRWVETAQQAKSVLRQATMVTFIADRESDFYALWANVPQARFHALSRVMHDRALAGGGTLAQVVAASPVREQREIELREQPGRSARKVVLSLRFGHAEIRRPRNTLDRDAPASLELRWVDVVEDKPPQGEEAVHWRLLTTHAIDDGAQAWQVIDWYKQRWVIEQFFRTLKLQGFNIEESQLQSAERLTNLVAIAVKAAAIVLQLVQTRDEDRGQTAKSVFSSPEIETLAAVEIKYTVNSKSIAGRNPYPSRSLAWASWIIARLGGWNGYPKAKPPGPITFYHGLQKLRTLAQGWALRDMCMP